MEKEIKYETEFESGGVIDVVSAILEIESTASSTTNIVKAWSYLAGTGMIPQLQGMYQRGMANFVNNDIMDNKGVVNWDYINHLLAENEEEHD